MLEEKASKEVRPITSSAGTIRVIIVVTPFVVGLGLLLQHLRIAPNALDVKGFPLLTERLFELLLAGLLSALTYCVGLTISRRLSIVFASQAEEIAFSVMLGTGAVGLAVLGLGLAGLLTPLPIILLLAILTAASSKAWRRLVELPRNIFAFAESSNSHQVIVLLFCGLLALLLTRAAVPPIMPDEVIYHLPVTKAFVERGRVFPVMDNFSGNLPFLIHMVYAVCLLAKADIAAKLFSLVLAVATALAVYAFCVRFLNRHTGFVALFAFFASGMVVEVAVTTRIDVSLAGMLFLTTYALMVWRQTQRRGWLIASAMLGGFSLGIKYTGAIWLALLGVMFLIESLLKRDSVSEIIRNGVLYALIATAVASPWYIKNAIWFRNPIYPFFTGEVAEYGAGRVRYFNEEDERKIAAHYERARQEIPSVVAMQEQALRQAAALRPERRPIRFWEYFTRPDDYNMAEPRHFPNWLFLLFPLLALAPPRRQVVWLLLLSASFFLISVRVTWLGRYLLPLYAPMTVVAAYNLTALAEGLRKRWVTAPLLPACVVGLALAWTVRLSVEGMAEKNVFSFLSGGVSRSEYLKATRYYYQPLDFINRNLPPDARVMMIGDQTAYDLQREHIAEGGWDSVEWRRALIRCNTLEDVHQQLKRRGITHIVYFPELFRFVAREGRKGSGPSGEMNQGAFLSGLGGQVFRFDPDYLAQQQNWATFEHYRWKHLEQIVGFETDNGFMVFRLR
jgi:4-amino-4-deoxy-L-arabinose transferase-like glycosyltransferase